MDDRDNSMRSERIEDRIKSIIVITLRLEINPREIGDNDVLFGGDMGLNSMAMIELVVGLEDEFGFEVSDEDLRAEVFESVQTMADYVRSALKGTVLPSENSP